HVPWGHTTRPAGFHVRKDVAPLKHTAYSAPPGAGSGGFHVRKDVAPLKRPCREPGEGLYTRFHVRKDVAPLKQHGPDSRRLQEARFHVRKDVAPLKPLHATNATGLGTLVSTFERTWLH